MACLWTRRRGVPLRCGDPPQDGQRAIDFLLSQMPALNGCLCRLTQGQVRANGRPFKVAEAIPASLFMNSGFEDRHGKYAAGKKARSEEHTSELQSLMRISYAVFCLKKKNKNKQR